MEDDENADAYDIDNDTNNKAEIISIINTEFLFDIFCAPFLFSMCFKTTGTFAQFAVFCTSCEGRIIDIPKPPSNCVGFDTTCPSMSFLLAVLFD